MDCLHSFEFLAVPLFVRLQRRLLGFELLDAVFCLDHLTSESFEPGL